MVFIHVRAVRFRATFQYTILIKLRDNGPFV
jgi:hypothetical protein